VLFTELVVSLLGLTLQRTNQVERLVQERTQQLRESETRFLQMAEHIDQVFWLSEATQHQILYVSPAYERIWGRSCASLYGQPMAFFDTLHPADREHVTLHMQQAQGTPGPQQCASEVEYRIIRPDGEVRWIRDRGFPVWDADGCLDRLVGCAEDITARKQAEIEAEQRRREAEILAELAQDINASLDLDTVLRRVSAAAGELCGSDHTVVSLRSPAG
jgi:PAS domain S-box-containing protein